MINGEEPRLLTGSQFLLGMDRLCGGRREGPPPPYTVVGGAVDIVVVGGIIIIICGWLPAMLTSRGVELVGQGVVAMGCIIGAGVAAVVRMSWGCKANWELGTIRKLGWAGAGEKA